MPILDVSDAQQVVFLKRSMRPGFAGIENELLFDPKTTLLFGDAKDTLTKVVSAVKTCSPGPQGTRARCKPRRQMGRKAAIRRLSLRLKLQLVTANSYVMFTDWG